MTERFASIHQHGMVRVAAATPVASAGDVGANAASILNLAKAASDEGADIVVFPELALSSYALSLIHI